LYIWKPVWAEDEEAEPGPRPDGWTRWGLVNRSKVYVLVILIPGAMEFSWLHFVQMEASIWNMMKDFEGPWMNREKYVSVAFVP
jgi:hypothetical protein